jgi:MFS family permease
MGAANAALQLGRFMAGEVHPVVERGRAISTVVMGGTVGAAVGPALVAPVSLLAESFAKPGLAGPYAASATFFAIGAVVVALLLRPDPRDLARLVVRTPGVAGSTAGARSLSAILGDSGVRAAMITMTLSQAVMTMLMVITSLHMSHHDHGLASISAVMSVHVLGMFAFSMVAGRLADRWGRRRLIAAGAACLVGSGLAAAPSVSVVALGAGLFLLGLGWSFCYVGASTLLSDRLGPAERARVQGLNDALLTGTAALGSLLSGVVFSAVGYAAMGLVCAAVAIVPLALGSRRVSRFLPQDERGREGSARGHAPDRDEVGRYGA